MIELLNIFRSMDAINASDIFLSVGKVPTARINGEICPLNFPPLTIEDVNIFAQEWLPNNILQKLEQELDIDLGISISNVERFRLNLYYQKNQISFAVRKVPSGALSFEALSIPNIVEKFAETTRGLLLVTGATGSGKSTTTAAMIHHINNKFAKHIVTVEDPIEFYHEDINSVISQREIGSDTKNFTTALKHIVRQNPDVIFIGEMRDLDTMQMAISAAMTGHLVISTMHTVDVFQTLERIINYYPAMLREQIAQDLSLSLVGVISQRLLPGIDGNRVPAFEILTATALAKKLIAHREFEELEEVIKAGSSDGMITFTRSLVQKVQEKRVNVEIAARMATNYEEFMLAIQGMETGINTLRGYGNDDERAKTDMKMLLNNAVRLQASDLLITAGSPPILRVNGVLRKFDMEPLTPSMTEKLFFSILSPTQRGIFESEKEFDFALSINNTGKDKIIESDNKKVYRFRVNGFYQKGSVACALRLIPQYIPDPESLMIPRAVMDLANLPQGLILITGPTGHGKSTTLACILDKINTVRSCHIITVEDPIEFVHSNKEAVIEQREVHADTKSFAKALKFVLRQDPDVVLIGEMRDIETIQAALTAAETGHLVFATLHTNDCSQTIDRIIDTFPGDQQNQIRSQLAACLEAIIAQRLLPAKNQANLRIAAFEVLLANTAVRMQIREGRTHQLLGTIETAAKEGMITMDKALLKLYNQGRISREIYKLNARNATAIL